MAVHTVTEVYNALMGAGFNAAESRKMTAISLRETGGSLDDVSHNFNPPREDSYGLFQINMLAHGSDTSVQCATDINCSAKYARKLYQSSGYQPWAGTQDEAGLQPYYTRVDAELNTSASGGFQNGGTTMVPGSDNELAQGVHDFLIIVAIEIVAFTLIAVGAWGIVSGKGDIGSTVSGAAGALKKSAGTALKLAAL